MERIYWEYTSFEEIGEYSVADFEKVSQKWDFIPKTCDTFEKLYLEKADIMGVYLMKKVFLVV
jgi:hypothetical protein